MNKTIILLLIIGLISCKPSDKEVSKLQIAQQYYNALDKSDASAIESLMADTILMRETEYDYEEVFTLDRYVEWLKWDSVFDPAYEILETEQENEIVRAKVSKIDTRISFLHQEPIVTNELIRFANGKIISIEKTKYVVFNEAVFVQTRDSLVSWIDKTHPELKGFIQDQTERGARNYLKAIELYKSGK